MTPEEIRALRGGKTRTVEEKIKNADAARDALREALIASTDAAGAEEAKGAAGEEESAVAPEEPVYHSFVGADRPAVRKAIEARCPPIDIDDLVMLGVIKQEVPIIPGKLVVTFSTISDADEVWCDAQAQSDAIAAGIPTKEATATRSLRYQLAISLLTVNNARYTPIARENRLPKLDGNASNIIGQRVLELTSSFETTVMNLILLNFRWFRFRVNNTVMNSTFL